MGQVALEEAKRIAEKEKKLEEEAKKIKAQKKAPKKKKRKKRGKKYLKVRVRVDRTKTYSLKKAIELVKKTSYSKFNGSVELHLVVKETGLRGKIDFPHPTGKKQKIAIADENLLKKIKKGEIDFDLLISSPEMMPKLAKYAKILGPKGLMPNPKNDTIAENPKKKAEELAEKTAYQTEKKAPLIHLVVGKVDHSAKKLTENIKTALNTIGLTKIKRAVLTATMSPGIKLDLEKI